MPLESDLEQTLRVLPDVSADFLINKSGTFRITLFYTKNNDPVLNQVQNGRIGQSTGAKLSYRKEFNSLSEFLFGRRKSSLVYILLSNFLIFVKFKKKSFSLLHLFEQRRTIDYF